MEHSRAQPIRCERFWRLANQELVILPSSERKLRKNALYLNQSAFSNFALYVISFVIFQIRLVWTSHWEFSWKGLLLEVIFRFKCCKNVRHCHQNSSPSQGYSHRGNHTMQPAETSELKPFSVFRFHRSRKKRMQVSLCLLLCLDLYWW